MLNNANGDARIRVALKESFANDDHPYVVFEELRISRGEGRADLALANGTLWGFEIKSDSDRLTRLPSQIKLYDRVFDFSVAVVARRHLTAVRRMLPKYWGIRIVDDAERELTITQVRAARRNHKTDPEALVKLLWRNEAVHALNNNGIRVSSTALVGEIWRELLAGVSRDRIATEVRNALKVRGGCGPGTQRTLSDGSCTTDSTVLHCPG